MNSLEKINQLSITRALIIGFVLAGLYYFIGYNDGTIQKNQIAAIEGQISTANKEIADVETKIKKAQQYKTLVTSMGSSFDVLVGYLPAKMSMADLMKAISTEAKAAGSNISRIQDAATRSDGAEFYDSLKVSTELSGTFPQHILFLSYLTRLEQILMVESMSMIVVNAQNSELGQSPQVALSASIVGYRYTGGDPEKDKKNKDKGKKK